jgi:hypothetical protein
LSEKPFLVSTSSILIIGKNSYEETSESSSDDKGVEIVDRSNEAESGKDDLNS